LWLRLIPRFYFHLFFLGSLLTRLPPSCSVFLGVHTFFCFSYLISICAFVQFLDCDRIFACFFADLPPFRTGGEGSACGSLPPFLLSCRPPPQFSKKISRTSAPLCNSNAVGLALSPNKNFVLFALLLCALAHLHALTPGPRDARVLLKVVFSFTHPSRWFPGLVRLREYRWFSLFLYAPQYPHDGGSLCSRFSTVSLKVPPLSVTVTSPGVLFRL